MKYESIKNKTLHIHKDVLKKNLSFLVFPPDNYKKMEIVMLVYKYYLNVNETYNRRLFIFTVVQEDQTAQNTSNVESEM
jgi:hypothetical protein